MATITGLAGVLLWTSIDGFEAMSRFYRETLGLVPRTTRPGFISFEFGDQRLTLAIHSEVTGSARDPLRIMVNLEVDDIHGMCEQLVEAGQGFLRLPEKERWGGWVATLHDPDGNTVQLLQLPGIPDGAP